MLPQSSNGVNNPIRRGICHMFGKAFCDNKVVMEGELMAQIVKKINMKQTLAFITPMQKLEKITIIEPFATINKNVEIGEGTWIGSNVTIMEGNVGKIVEFFLVLSYAIPQDLNLVEKIVSHELVITQQLECVTVNRGTSASGEAIVGDNCLLAVM